MSDTEVAAFLREIGCCDSCCLRYLGVKTRSAYNNSKDYIETHLLSPRARPEQNSVESTNGNSDEVCLCGRERSSKRRKWAICICCIGILQEDTWEESLENVQDVLDKKKYTSKTFAVGLSAPIVIPFREKCITLLLEEKFPNFKKPLTALKEAWKWSFGIFISKNINKVMEPPYVTPLLIVFNVDYPNDDEELLALKQITPHQFESRNRQNRYQDDFFFSRSTIDQALVGLTLSILRERWHCPPPLPLMPATCISVTCRHEPIYLGGRYIKLSRELPQTPWTVRDVKMAETSVQELIFHEIAEIFKIPKSDSETHLKLLSAGREDVDVRCLGNGRPFAVEINDPLFTPTEEQLSELCLNISSTKKIIVKSMKIVPKNDLALLKSGEETKHKVYEALCIKLTHSETDLPVSEDTPIKVTQTDIDNINSFTNVTDGSCKVLLQQITPIRVLHRRSLHARPRKIIDVQARLVPDHPQLFIVRLRTEAGTYIKEWVHSDLGRTKPSLFDAIKAEVDIVALDVCAVELEWPKS